MSEPFCLLFADNTPPPADHVFYLSSPWYEPRLNSHGRVRIDPDAMQPIAPERLIETPWLLKALFRGTGLDVHLIERLLGRGLPTLAQWWSAAGLASGDGYQRSSTRMDATHLRGRPHLTPGDLLARRVDSLRIDAHRLPAFAIPRLHRTRDEAIYAAPLLLLRESVRVNARRVHISDEALVYNESFYGYSAHGHPDGRLLVRYLALLLSSRLFEWYNLVTGGKFGVEREVWHKVDVDAFPFMPIEQLDDQRRGEIEPLFDAYAAGRASRDTVDDWVLGVYDLGVRAGEVITDTLTMASPHHAAKTGAAAPPEPAMIDAFAARLGERLAPFAAVDVRVVSTAPEDPYRALVIGTHLTDADAHHPIAQRVLQLADRLGSSEYVLTDDATGRIWLGRLAQRRYWTLSRARLTAARLLEGPLGRP
ncbi:MAG: hypothetical protein H6701_09855 [Myxococcales bacterium]|nr:hypothetical protein [Myxococcales bacterium]